jgi:hypothetical protein
LIGRRVGSFAEIEQPGDYCLIADALCSVTEDGDEIRGPTVYFRLPTLPDGYHGARSIHAVRQPPHVFRECDDGSVEIRESIAIPKAPREGDGNWWHGYLDEGHSWRTV